MRHRLRKHRSDAACLHSRAAGRSHPRRPHFPRPASRKAYILMTRAATFPGGFDPSGGYFPPGTQPQSDAPSIQPWAQTELSKCTAGCLNAKTSFQKLLPSGIFDLWLIDPQYQQCVLACNNLYSSAAGMGTLTLGGSNQGQAGCGVTNLPPCFDLFWTYVAHAGIEIALVALALLGVYLWLK